MPTNVAAVIPRSFAAHSEESKQQARVVLDQIGMYPLDEDQPGQRSFGYEADAATAIFPPGLTARCSRRIRTPAGRNGSSRNRSGPISARCSTSIPG